MSADRLRRLLADFELTRFERRPFITMNGNPANGAVAMAVKR